MKYRIYANILIDANSIEEANEIGKDVFGSDYFSHAEAEEEEEEEPAPKKLPKLAMSAEVIFLHHKKEDNSFEKVEPDCISPGGYEFVVNGKKVPFDWDAYSGSFNKKKHFEFTTGYGFAFNDFTLPDYYDEDLAKEGLSRADITAEFLARCEKIEEFYIDFECEDCDEADVYPTICNISLINMCDEEVANGAQAEFLVEESVIKAYNDDVLKLMRGECND